MKNTRKLLGVFIFATLGVTIAAEQGGVVRREEPPASGNEIQSSSVRFVEAWRPRGSATATRVVGTVIDIRQIPVAGASVQLRNLDNGTVEHITESNDLGEYAFELDDPGTFVVEMVMVDGYVVALSNAGSLARYETLQTVLQLPGRWDRLNRSLIPLQNVVNYFGMSAATSMTGATMTIAADANITPANAGVPVSP